MTSNAQQLPAVTTIPSSVNKKIFIFNNSSASGSTSILASSSTSSSSSPSSTTPSTQLQSIQSQNSAPNHRINNNSTTTTTSSSSSPNLVKLINMNKLNGTIKTSQSVATPAQFSIKSNGLIASSNTTMPKPLMINNLNHHSQSNTSNHRFSNFEFFFQEGI